MSSAILKAGKLYPKRSTQKYLTTDYNNTKHNAHIDTHIYVYMFITHKQLYRYIDVHRQETNTSSLSSVRSQCSTTSQTIIGRAKEPAALRSL